MQNKKSKIPYIFFAFFAVFITADIFFIYLAKTTWRGTVTEDAYEKGRKYNKTLLSNKKQKDLDWKAKIDYEILASKKSLIIFELKDEKNRIIKDAKVKVKFVRPTQTGFDFKEELNFDNKSKYYKKIIDFPLIGLWKVEIQAFARNELLYEVKRIVID